MTTRKSSHTTWTNERRVSITYSDNLRVEDTILLQKLYTSYMTDNHNTNRTKNGVILAGKSLLYIETASTCSCGWGWCKGPRDPLASVLSLSSYSSKFHKSLQLTNKQQQKQNEIRIFFAYNSKYSLPNHSFLYYQT